MNLTPETLDELERLFNDKSPAVIRSIPALIASARRLADMEADNLRQREAIEREHSWYETACAKNENLAKRIDELEAEQALTRMAYKVHGEVIQS